MTSPRLSFCETEDDGQRSLFVWAFFQTTCEVICHLFAIKARRVCFSSPYEQTFQSKNNWNDGALEEFSDKPETFLSRLF